MWTSYVTTIALEMVVPGLIGYWIDQRLSTGVVFLVLGVVVGFSVGLSHLMRLTRPADGKQDPPLTPPEQ